MRRLYFDANYLGKLQWQERGMAEVIACASGADEIATALHGRAEFYSIGHRKLREGTAAAVIGSVFAQFNAESSAERIIFLPLTDAIIDRIENVFATAPITTYLRAADALHLATAAENGFSEIHSNDKHLLAAAPLFGLLGVNVIP
jgi:predicted nucleic acid-binding protein